MSDMSVLSRERFCDGVVIATLCRYLRELRRRRIPVTRINLLFNPRWYGAWVSLVLTLAPTGATVTAEAAGPAKTPAAAQTRRNVHATPLPTTSVDGQASWIIEPDVPRIPNIAGLQAQLPPHVERRLSYAFDLAQRGASYSANAEFREVLNLCALELDAREGGISRREALHLAWLALDEADEFNVGRSEMSDTQDIRSVAAGHKTPVLNGHATGAADSIQAVQAYYAFAEERFAYSCREMPGASLAFYGLARTFVVPGTEVAQAAGKAALLQRVALAIAPQNVLARNELGVLLAEYGQLDQAERLFQQCLATNPTPETWRNLAVVYARQGDRSASQSALASADKLEGNERGAAQPGQASLDRSAATTPAAEAEQKPKFWKRLSLSNLRNALWR
jgi:tetratricopeptide (TPR) repeat protein